MTITDWLRDSVLMQVINLLVERVDELERRIKELESV